MKWTTTTRLSDSGTTVTVSLDLSDPMDLRGIQPTMNGRCVMKITPDELKEARDLYEKGVDIWSLSEAFGVHYDTMRRYLRHFDLYGVSIFSPNPQYVEDKDD